MFIRQSHTQTLDLGDEHQMALELRPAHDPTKAHGFLGVVVSVADLSASIWTWFRDGDRWAIEKTITIPAVAADPEWGVSRGRLLPVHTLLDAPACDRGDRYLTTGVFPG